MTNSSKVTTKQNAKRNPLETRFVLVNFSQSKWGAKAKADNLAIDMAHQKNADPAAFKVSKELVDPKGNGELAKRYRKVGSITGKAYNYHRHMTVNYIGKNGYVAG